MLSCFFLQIITTKNGCWIGINKLVLTYLWGMAHVWREKKELLVKYVHCSDLRPSAQHKALVSSENRTFNYLMSTQITANDLLSKE